MLAQKGRIGSCTFHSIDRKCILCPCSSCEAKHARIFVQLFLLNGFDRSMLLLGVDACEIWYWPVTAAVDSIQALSDVMLWPARLWWRHAVKTTHREIAVRSICYILIASSLRQGALARCLLACHQLSITDDISPYSDVTLLHGPPTALRGAEHTSDICRHTPAS